MVESKPITSLKTDEPVIIFWILHNSKFDKLRTLEKCNGLQDLTATITDVEHIKNLAKCYGVKE